MPDITTLPLPTVNPLSSISSIDAPRVDLTKIPVDEMTEDQLREFVKFVRERRTSQQLSNENKPQRRKKGDGETASPTKKAALLAGLLATDEESEESV